MLTASRLVALLTFALVLSVSSYARAEEQADYPVQKQFEARQIHASHAIRNCGHMMPPPVQEMAAAPILFPTASDKLTPAAMASVKKIAATLKSPAYHGHHVIVSGYTDNKGKDASNQRLSYHRAVMVTKELVKLGVPASQMTAQGFGSEHPVASNETPDGRALNRRVTVTLAEPPHGDSKW